MDFLIENYPEFRFRQDFNMLHHGFRPNRASQLWMIIPSPFYRWGKWTLKKWNCSRTLSYNVEDPGFELSLVPEPMPLGTELYYLIEALMWKEIWGFSWMWNLILQVRNPSPREGQWFAHGQNYFGSVNHASLCLVCKTELIGYGDSSLKVSSIFIISAIHKPVLKSWKNGVVYTSFQAFFSYVRHFSNSVNGNIFAFSG